MGTAHRRGNSQLKSKWLESKSNTRWLCSVVFYNCIMEPQEGSSDKGDWCFNNMRVIIGQKMTASPYVIIGITHYHSKQSWPYSGNHTMQLTGEVLYWVMKINIVLTAKCYPATLVFMKQKWCNFKWCFCLIWEIGVHLVMKTLKSSS